MSDYEHFSDCAVNNGPALEAGACDCGASERKLIAGGLIRRAETACRMRRPTDNEFEWAHKRAVQLGLIEEDTPEIERKENED